MTPATRSPWIGVCILKCLVLEGGGVRELRGGVRVVNRCANLSREFDSRFMFVGVSASVAEKSVLSSSGEAVMATMPGDQTHEGVELPAYGIE